MSFRRLSGGALGRSPKLHCFGGLAPTSTLTLTSLFPPPSLTGGALEKRRATESHFQPPAAPQAWFCPHPSLWPQQRTWAAFLDKGLIGLPLHSVPAGLAVRPLAEDFTPLGLFRVP